MPVISDVVTAQQDPLDVCNCFDDSPEMDVVAIGGCASMWHRKCLLSYREYHGWFLLKKKVKKN
jgi:hypothetical protein